uniref:trichohyalin-like n=1 Tax=Epinephelus lanceolatus TaxID=310571 RepID=UPI0014467327
MDRRMNNRQRPAGDAAGHRGPPQHHYHQNNNASWGNLEDAEHQKFRHIIKKKKDQIKQNYQLTLALQRQEKESKLRFEEMVAKYEAERQTASNQINQVFRQEVESQVQSVYQEKEAQMEKKIHQMGADLLKIHEEQQGLFLTLADAHTAVTSKNAALQQSEEAWQEKYEALREKLTTDMEEKNKKWETQENEFTIKVSLMEEQIHQRDVEILRLTEDNNCLIEKLAETTQELTCRATELQSQKAWQNKNTALENITKHLAEKQQSWEREVAQLIANKAELEDLCLFIHSKRKRFLLFPRRSSDDRETQLQQLKTKMQQKAAKAREAEKMEEEMEAADCSAQAGQQLPPRDVCVSVIQ